MGNILRVCGSLQLLGMLAAGFGPAKAAQFEINASSPHLCAVVEGGKTASGTPVIAYSCSGGPEDQWNVSGFGEIQGLGTGNGKSMCLHVNGANPGSLVDLSTCSLSVDQVWAIGNGTIANVASGLCLDSSGGPSTGGGTQLVTNNCSGATSQNWIVRAMQLELNGNAPYKCVAVNAGDTANGTAVLSYSCADSPQQVWSFLGGQIQGIGTENGTSKCLTATGLTAGSLIVLSSCVPSESTQNWLYDRNNELLLAMLDSPLCLDGSGGPGVGGGTQLILSICSGIPSQVWDIR